MTPDIKELLTLAAKACGYEVSHFSPESGGYLLLHGEQDIWAPHLDDGDGARMEAKLQLGPNWYRPNFVRITRAGVPIGSSAVCFADHNGDEQAARRWASLRAAAQIGKGMT